MKEDGGERMSRFAVLNNFSSGGDTSVILVISHLRDAVLKVLVNESQCRNLCFSFFDLFRFLHLIL